MQKTELGATSGWACNSACALIQLKQPPKNRNETVRCLKNISNVFRNEGERLTNAPTHLDVNAFSHSN